MTTRIYNSSTGSWGQRTCSRMPSTSTAEDRKAAHASKMAWKRSRPLARNAVAGRPVPLTRNADPAYRKSIWPAARIARRAAS